MDRIACFKEMLKSAHDTLQLDLALSAPNMLPPVHFIRGISIIVCLQTV